MKNIFKNKNILITGGAGTIGTEIVKQLLEYDPRTVRVLDNCETAHFNLVRKFSTYKFKHKIRNLVGDIRDKDRVIRAMDGVDIVFHAGALKHVGFCEANPFEAVATNVIGTKNLVEVALDKKIKYFIGISTDKAVNPINTMGATKLLSEKIIINAPVGSNDQRFSCVRFGNILDSVGSIIPILKHQISCGEKVTITSDQMTRFFMTKEEAIKLVLNSARSMKGGEIFVLKMNSLRIIDLVEVMIEELAPKYGFDPKKYIIDYIGVRAGEKLDEVLFTEEEAGNVKYSKGVYVLKNVIHIKSKELNKSYNSGNVNFMTKKEIKNILYSNLII